MDMSVWDDETKNSRILLIPGDTFLTIILRSGDVMTDVSVWADNFSLFTILVIPFLIIKFI